MTTSEPHRFLPRDLLAMQGSNGSEVLTLAPLDLRPLPEPRQSMRDALERPEDFPPVHDAIVPGDSIVIAVDPNLPNLLECVQGVLDAIKLDQVSHINVLLGEDASADTVEQLRSSVGEQATIHVHDPESQETLGYLAADELADPIYLNRLLLEADVVIPLAIARPDGSLDPRCEAGGIFPQFADRRSQQRIREAQFRKRHASGASPMANDRASEAAWLLGIQMVVEVLPTIDALAAEIVAGTPSGVQRRLASAIESSWQRWAPSSASLVVACIDGNEQQQHWNNIARAVYIASQIVDVGGTIVVCCNVSQIAGPGMRRLAADDSFEDLLKATRKDLSRDSLVTNVLLRVREECRILLASDVPRDQLEDLGLGAIDSLESLRRLIDQHATTIVMRGAQFCVAAIGESDDA